MRGKFNISLFIHLLIPWLGQAQCCRRGALLRSAVPLRLRTNAVCLRGTHGHFILEALVISESIRPEEGEHYTD